MEAGSLYRNDETQWSFRKGNQEIRLITPGFSDRATDYKLAEQAELFLQAQSSMDKWVAWECLGQRWQITDVTRREYKKLQAGSIIYKRDFTNLNVRVLKIEPTSSLHAATLRLEKWIPWFSHPTSPKIMRLPFDRKDLAGMFFKDGAFCDPFTRLSERALQRYETPFVSEHASAGSYHFSLEDGILSLKAASSNPKKSGEAAAVVAYRDFLIKAFEWRTLRNTKAGLETDLKAYPDAFDLSAPPAQERQFLGYLKETYDIDFEEMIKEGKPLLPDHVYKCNIAANQIEMTYAESFYLRLDRCLKATLKDGRGRSFGTSLQFYEFLKEQGLDRLFSMKEIEGIYRSFIKYSPEKTSHELKKYLASFTYLPAVPRKEFGEAIRCLTPEAFHRLMEILFVGFEALSDPMKTAPENFFTGRQIAHLAICGYKTMGNRNIYDPCRNASEFLHIFPQLQRGHLLHHNELLAHVVGKKALHQCYPSRKFPGEVEWRAGRLIPFAQQDGISRWYYVDGYLNDGEGDVNYVLIPACRGYLEAGGIGPFQKIIHEKSAPLIKLYRSTASDAEAESSTDSVLADLNPKQVGSLDFDRGDEYELPYFQRCTMPIWVGYLAIGDIDQAAQCFLETCASKNHIVPNANGKEANLIHFLDWQKKEKSKTAAEIYREFKKRVGAETLLTFFTGSALGAEWAKNNKVAQDIHFVGHSLGAALSQDGIYHFGPRNGRIPLSGCNFKCFAFDPPGGVTPEQNNAFVNFGRKHKELLKSLGQKWGIHYQFEYQDFIPQGGAEWLGVTKDSQLDAEWLDLTGTLFRPLPTAVTQEITTMPTHGRRFHHLTAEEAKTQYQSVPLSSQELYAFKHSFWLPLELRLKFGFFLTTPKLTEKLRESVGGTVLFPLVWFKRQLQNLWISQPKANTDSSGVTFYSVNSPDLSPEEKNKG